MRKTINLILILISANFVFAGAREEVRRDFQKTVALSSGKSFRIDNSLGHIFIRTHSQSQADIRATIKCSADTASEAKSVCDQIHISVQETSTGVSVVTEYPRSEGLGRRNIGFGVDYDIVIPDSTPLEVKNRFGNIKVIDLHAATVIQNSNGAVSVSGGRGRQQIGSSFGNIEVRTNAGDLVIKNGNGDVVASDITGNIEISDRFGKVTVTNATGNVTINNSNGTIDVGTVGGVASIINTFGAVTVTSASGDLTVNNQNGAVRATNVKGSADLRTTFDRITFSGIGRKLDVRASNSSVTGDTVGENATIETTFGTVDVRDVKGGSRVTANNTSITLRDISGEVYARTTFNGVTINNAGGPISVENQNGSVTVDSRGSRCQPISLSTTFGPIRVSLPEGIGYNVNARTSFGRISSEPALTVTGLVTSEAVSGMIAGGGCSLRIVGQNGNVEILKGPK